MLRKASLITLAVAFAMATLFSSNALARKDEVKIVYVEWSCATASTNVVAAVLQEKMGYDVETVPVSAAAMWKSVATGSADAFTTAWLPTTHDNYYQQTKDELVDLGPNLKGTRIGLVVPEYVDIKTIGQMEDHAEKFDGKIIGIDPGAGIMGKTEKVLDAYNLDSIKLMEGSGATMTAALQNAIHQDEWIAVTGWTPHWKFARWDLKYLEDPKGIYGGEEFINTIARQGLQQDMPEVYAFLDNFHWELDDIHEVMDMNRAEGTTPYENAVKWINDNPQKVQAWMGK